MKKIFVILLINIFISVVYGQANEAAVTNAYGTIMGTAVSVLNSDIDGISSGQTQIIDTLGWKNVLSYGADNGGTNSAVAAIQAAITAAEVDSSTVFIPAGLYYMPDSIVPKSGMNVLADRTARFYTDEDNTIVYSAGRLRDFSWKGGIFISTGTFEGTAFKLVSAATANDMVRNSFTDIRVDDMKMGIEFAVSGTGYITTSEFRNITIWACETGIKMRGGSGSYSTNGLTFDHVIINSAPSALYGIDGVYGSRNMFTNIEFYDFYTGSGGFAGSTTVYFHESSTNNYMVGVGIAPLVVTNVVDVGFYDDGRGNYIISDGTVLPYNRHLADNTAAITYSLSMPDNSAAGGEIFYTAVIESDDQDSIQCETGTIQFSGVNVAGTETYSIDATDAGANYSESHAGLTLTTTWSISAFNGYMHVYAKFDSNIPSPTIRLFYHAQQRSGFNAIHWAE